jgi:hypothetical protein
MADTVPFLSAKLKIERAYQHILEVERWVADFIDLNPQSMGIYKNPETGNVGLQVTQQRPYKFPTLALPIVIGDVVHNLRTALDHVASEILRPFGIDPETSSFPIDVNRQSLIGKPHYRVIKQPAPDIAIIIADFIDSSGSKFVGLNHLDRVDKHRLLISIVSVAKATVTAIDDDNNISNIPEGTLLILPSGQPVTPDSPADLHNKRNSKATVLICFAEGEPFENEPVIPTLHQLLQLVTGILQALEAHIQGSPPRG